MIKKVIAFFALGAMIACGGPKTDSTDEATEVEAVPVEEVAVEYVAPAKEVRIVPEEGAEVIFENIEDGATLISPFEVVMGVTGMGVEPAGDKVTLGMGHHHILINSELGYVPQGEIVPMDENNIHFGKGQTETTLELVPGSYTLSLQFANAFHESYGEQMSKTITVVVQ